MNFFLWARRKRPWQSLMKAPSLLKFKRVKRMKLRLPVIFLPMGSIIITAPPVLTAIIIHPARHTAVIITAGTITAIITTTIIAIQKEEFPCGHAFL